MSDKVEVPLSQVPASFSERHSLSVGFNDTEIISSSFLM